MNTSSAPNDSKIKKEVIEKKDTPGPESKDSRKRKAEVNDKQTVNGNKNRLLTCIQVKKEVKQEPIEEDADMQDSAQSLVPTIKKEPIDANVVSTELRDDVTRLDSERLDFIHKRVVKPEIKDTGVVGPVNDVPVVKRADLVIKQETKAELEKKQKSSVLDQENSKDIQKKSEAREIHKKIPTGEADLAGVKRFSCPICQRTFSQKGSLTRHELTHNKDREKPFSCEDCGNKFTLKANLKTHNLIHKGEKPFTCDICEKSFTQMSNMQQHRTTHSGPTGKKSLANKMNIEKNNE